MLSVGHDQRVCTPKVHSNSTRVRFFETRTFALYILGQYWLALD